jgi:putative two-component system response regulator
MMMISDYAQLARLLVVDDEETNRRLLDRILRSAGYSNVRTLGDSRAVESVVEEFDPDLLLLDLHMPYLDGFAVLKHLAPYLTGTSYLPVLMLTGDSTAEAKRGALSLGARDFVPKPFDATEVLLRIRNMLESRFLHRELESQNSILETRVEERARELGEAQLESVERLARAAEIRDDATGRHTHRVGQLSALTAEALGTGSRYVELIRRAGALHDVGKIGIPDSVLLKAGKLTREEIDVMRSHTVIGARILSGGQSELVRMAEQVALCHHEKWKGNGYPQRLMGDQIPLEARIVALADFFDALTHPRPYRPAWPVDDVLDEVRRQSGSHFDPAIVATFLESRCYEPLLLPSILRSQEVTAVNGQPH